MLSPDKLFSQPNCTLLFSLKFRFGEHCTINFLFVNLYPRVCFPGDITYNNSSLNYPNLTLPSVSCWDPDWHRILHLLFILLNIGSWVTKGHFHLFVFHIDQGIWACCMNRGLLNLLLFFCSVILILLLCLSVAPAFSSSPFLSRLPFYNSCLSTVYFKHSYLSWNEVPLWQGIVVASLGSDLHRNIQRQLVYSDGIWNNQNVLFVVSLQAHYTVPFITVLVECVPRTWTPELWKCGHIQLPWALKRYLSL